MTTTIEDVNAQIDEVTSETMVPDLLRQYPAARRVLDRYGLSGCGGHSGPAETLGFFARAHGVDEQRLLKELREVCEQPESTEPVESHAPSIADTIYRRFFLAGIAIILTAGASWGALLLWQIGFTGKFTGISIHDVNAHGHAQIYGWVGLFIMGFAYQAFPRMWHTPLAKPKLAVAAFSLMGFGLILRTIAMTLAGKMPGATELALVGGLAELIAAIIFVAQMLLTFRNRDADVTVEPYVGFVVAALGWFVVMAGFDVWYTHATMSATSREALLKLVSTYQAPLRDLQIHGLALSMILGVSLRMLPALFGVQHVGAKRAWWALGLVTIGVAAESVLFIVYRQTGNHALAAALMLPWIMLAAGSAMVALPWKLWRRLPSQDRSGKFVRMAYLWLAISMVMLLLLPVYQLISKIPFSHAYYGAIRHAITVGFISLMIMGFAAKAVATLNGFDTRKLTALWGPFILVNIGCFLRCSLQTLTDWHAGFFPWVGVSGTLEVAGLTWWGLHLVGLMRHGKRMEQTPPEPVSQPSWNLAITPESYVANVLLVFPETLKVFNDYGFTMLNNRVARNTIAKSVTIATAAKVRGVCADELLVALRRAAGQPDELGGRACDGCDHDDEHHAHG